MSGLKGNKVGKVGEGACGVSIINELKSYGLKVESDLEIFESYLFTKGHENVDPFAKSGGSMLGVKIVEDIFTWCENNNVDPLDANFEVKDTSYVDVTKETKDIEVILTNGEFVKNFPFSLKTKTNSGTIIYSKGSASNVIFFEKVLKGTNLLTKELLELIDESELKEGFKPFFESNNKSYSKANKEYNAMLGFNWKHERKNLLAKGLKMVIENCSKEELNIIGKNILKLNGFSNTPFGLALRKANSDASTILTTLNNKVWNKLSKEDVTSVEVNINAKSTLKIKINGIEFGTDYNAATFCMSFNPYKMFNL